MPLKTKIYRKRVTRSHLCPREITLVIAGRMERKRNWYL